MRPTYIDESFSIDLDEISYMTSEYISKDGVFFIALKTVRGEISANKEQWLKIRELWTPKPEENKIYPTEEYIHNICIICNKYPVCSDVDHACILCKNGIPHK